MQMPPGVREHLAAEIAIATTRDPSLTRQHRRAWVGGLAAGALLASPGAQACWEAAANRYGISSALLYAIAQTESSLNPRAIGHNRNGSRDIGLMQINSWWLPRLAAYGITEAHLFDPCTNLHVGAWILAGNVQRLGYRWEAVGAYHARNPALRMRYAHSVSRKLQQLAGQPHR